MGNIMGLRLFFVYQNEVNIFKSSYYLCKENEYFIFSEVLICFYGI
jgi:hypothetical protein